MLPVRLRNVVNRLPLLAAVAALLLTSGCKKDKDTVTSSPVEGTWQSLNPGDSTYMVLQSNGYVTFLQSGPYGVRGKTTQSYAADQTSITIDIGSSSLALYNYTLRNDSLFLKNPSKSLVYKKATGIDAANWVKPISILQSTPLWDGFYFGPLEWNGSNFFISNAYTKKLFKLDPNSLAIIDSATITQKGSASATVGADLWVNNIGTDKKLHNINFATGGTISSSADATAFPTLMAGDGNSIWYFNADEELYQYDVSTNTHTLQAAMPGFVGAAGSGIVNPDMVIYGGYGYICFGYSIFKLDLFTHRVIETYNLDSSTFLLGIAHNGTNFYALSISGFGSLAEIKPQIHKIQF